MRPIRSFARAVLSRFGSWYWRLQATEPIWALRNRRARELWRTCAPALAPRESAMAESLRRDGVAVAHISEFFPGLFAAELLAAAAARWADPAVQAVVRERQAIAATGSKPLGVRKFFLVNLWAEPMVLNPENPFLRFSLSEPVLRIVGAYLGLLPKFRFWHLEATVPAGRIGPLASQRWHRDPEDQKLVKVFLYLNGVDASAGPFTYLRASHPGGRWRNLFPLAPPRGSRPMPPDEDRFIPQEDVRQFAGRAGTLIFCDTTGLHRGGFARERPRLMYTSVYTSSASPWPIRYRYSDGFDASGLSPLARFAVANNPRQRPPKFYR